MNHKNSNHLRLRYLLSYLLMMFVPFVLYIITFASATDLIKENIKNSHLTALKQSQALVDDQLYQISSLSLQLSNDAVFKRLFNLQGEVPTSSYYDFNEATQHFTNYLKGGEQVFESNYYIYFYGTDRILLPDTLYQTQIYHDFALKFPKDKYSDWINLLRQPFQNITIIKNENYASKAFLENNIILMQSLPRGYSKSPQATLVAHIDKNELSSFFTLTQNAADTAIYIENSDGELVSVISGGEKASKYHSQIKLKEDEDFFSENVNGEKLLISYRISDANGWKYISVVPENAVLEKLNKFKRLSIIAIISASVIGIAIAFTLATRNAKPILRISEKMRELLPDEQDSTFSSIEVGISRLVENNQNLLNELNLRRPFLQKNFISCLFSGNFSSKEELENLSAYTDIKLDFNGFVALIIRFDTPNSKTLGLDEISSINICKIMLQNIIQETLPMRKLWNELDCRTTGVLLEMDEVSQKDCEMLSNAIKSVLDKIIAQSQTEVYFAFGEFCKSPFEVWRSVDQAMQALEYAAPGNSIVWYRDLIRDGNSYYYPLDAEQKLINFAKTGDFVQVNKLIDAIAEENLNSRTISLYASKELSGEIRSTLRRILISYPELEHLNGRLKELKCTYFDENFIKSVRGIYKEICETAKISKKTANGMLIEKIQDYICENYADSDLGLYKISSHFNMSEGYFSYYFKNACGVNFTDYLENVRLSKAEELLKKENMTIDKIAETVGYNSAQSFRRAFKKVYGINPTVLRQKQ